MFLLPYESQTFSEIPPLYCETHSLCELVLLLIGAPRGKGPLTAREGYQMLLAFLSLVAAGRDERLHSDPPLFPVYEKEFFLALSRPAELSPYARRSTSSSSERSLPYLPVRSVFLY